jgi:hypothetical protein
MLEVEEYLIAILHEQTSAAAILQMTTEANLIPQSLLGAATLHSDIATTDLQLTISHPLL